MRRLLFALLVFPSLVFSQTLKDSHASAIKLKLKRLNFLGSVLYVAAHPDDENTQIITAMANERLAATGYLSMTRGDGGQNLIGPEMRDLLGLIRTQELLAARRLDGGEQFFTRAVDFGFSKSAEETFRLWNKDSILYDVVKVFRTFQPDVIITRFPPDERAGHGQHTASAILALDAFDVAAKPNLFPNQLSSASPWQPKRLYTNTGRWWNSSINENTPGIVSVNVGGYSPLTGISFSELAARSRSQHKSQGFGSRLTRGRQLEFLEYQKGERAEKDLFEGINTTWTRLKGGEKIQPLVLTIIKNFDEENPAGSLPALLNLRKGIMSLDAGVWRDRKLKEVEQIISDCAGLFLQVSGDQYWASPGQPVSASFELLNRSPQELSVEKITVGALSFDTVATMILKQDIPILFQRKSLVKNDVPYSDPYWLKESHDIGTFTIKDRSLLGKPENDPAVTARFTIRVGAESFVIEKPMIYKWTDPVKGELSRPFEIVPPVFLNISDDVFIFKDTSALTVGVVVKSAGTGSLSGKVKLLLPQGWKTEPSDISFSLSKPGEEQLHLFKVIPSAEELTGKIKAVATIGDKIFDKSLRVISYDHIPHQTLLPISEAKVVRVNLNKPGGTIAYLKGAGDDVPDALRSMGFNVLEMKNEDVTAENLRKVDAVVLGIRALNTNERIRFLMQPLLNYVKDGGTLVVQYNTSFDLETDTYSPYPLKISRDRVTEENSEVRILKPDHKALNVPNKITVKDFDNWVQERGLYFPNEWDPNFEALLSMNDKNEPVRNGSLLVAKHGNGYFVYTGLSFFRQLPEGVPGAYKLFANLMSLSKHEPEVISAEPLRKKKKIKN